MNTADGAVALQGKGMPGGDAARSLPVRLRPGDDLRGALEAAVAGAGVQAAFVVAGIGSLRPALLRLAGAEAHLTLEGHVELLGLSGSIAADGSHLHMSVSDAAGLVCGGHVVYGCKVRTTAEVLLSLLPGWRFRRVLDAATGWAELVIEPLPLSAPADGGPSNQR